MHASWRKKKEKKRKLEGEESPAHKQPNNLSPLYICMTCRAS
jgi:hypothetical protein